MFVSLVCLHMLCSHSHIAAHDILMCLYLPGLVFLSYNERAQLSRWQLSLRDASYINEKTSLQKRTKSISSELSSAVPQQWTASVYPCSSKKFPSVGGWCALTCTLMFYLSIPLLSVLPLLAHMPPSFTFSALHPYGMSTMVWSDNTIAPYLNGSQINRAQERINTLFTLKYQHS